MFTKLFKYWKAGAVPVMSVFAFSYILTIVQEKEFIFTTIAFSLVVPVLVGLMLDSFKKTKIN